MLLYRIAKTKYIRDLSGEGARKAGGRWNAKGIPVLYMADSTALATLETLVHFPLHLAPKHRSIAILELPETLLITRVESNKLPDRWWTYPAPSELASIGDNWWHEQATVALSVPSSITPQGEGRNLLLNLTHPDFNQISIIEVKEYHYDERLLNI